MKSSRKLFCQNGFFLPKFSLLSLGQLANTKQGEQYKNYKVYTRVQTFHNERKENTKYTV